MTTRIPCSNCGKPVSSEVPHDTMIRAWVECPECIEKSEARFDIIKLLKDRLVEILEKPAVRRNKEYHSGLSRALEEIQKLMEEK